MPQSYASLALEGAKRMLSAAKARTDHLRSNTKKDKNMKAARIQEYNKPLVLEDVPIPDTQPDEILVHVRHAECAAPMCNSWMDTSDDTTTFQRRSFRVTTAEGPQFGPPGYEVSLLYIAGLLALILGGAGHLSIDGLLARSKGEQEASPS